MSGIQDRYMTPQEKHAPFSAGQQDGYRIDILRSTNEIENVRSIWERFQRHPNSDMDSYLTVLGDRKEVARPHVMLLRRGEQPNGMLIGRLEDVRLDCSIGYLRVYRPRVRSLTVIYSGFLGDLSDGAPKLILRELLSSLRKREADVVFLNKINMESSFFRLCRETLRFPYRNYPLAPNPHWRLALPPSYADFFAGLPRKTRENLRRHASRLKKEFSDSLAIHCFRDPADLDRITRDTQTITGKSYLGGIQALPDAREWENRIRLWLGKGCFSAYFLYLEGKPCAYQHLVRYAGTAHAMGTAYDPAFQRYAPGRFLQMRVIECLCGDDGIEMLDYGFGDAEYKREICNEKWYEADVYMFAPTFSGMRVSVGFTGASLISAAARAIVARTGHLARVKKLWRDLLR